MNLKHLISTILVLLISLEIFSQKPRELKQIESGTEYWEIWKKASPLLESDKNAAIILIEDAIKNTDNSFTKSSLMKQLGGLYIDTKQYDKCLDAYEDLINSGISVFFEFRGNIYPIYTKFLEDND